ncbi:hypothetical protein F4811DRAFT_572756 [Daldinia bambusicola]|nr:hypothetical protein F4811DRAFT_572756 [Daldinia bambusicola]
MDPSFYDWNSEERQRVRRGEYTYTNAPNQGSTSQAGGSTFNAVNTATTAAPAMTPPTITPGMQSASPATVSTTTPHLSSPPQLLAPPTQTGFHTAGPMYSPNVQTYIPYRVDPGMSATPYIPGIPYPYNMGPSSMPPPTTGFAQTPIQANATSYAATPAPANATGYTQASAPPNGTNSAPVPAANLLGASAPVNNLGGSPDLARINRRVSRSHRARRSRQESENDGASTPSENSGNSEPQWRPGMRQVKILDSWSEQRKQAARIKNDWIARSKADHTRKQNRVSARKSRQKKEDALQDAQNTARILEDQNRALASQVASLTRQSQQHQEEAAQYSQGMAMLAAENEAMRERIAQLEGQVFQSSMETARNQPMEGVQATETPLQNQMQNLNVTPTQTAGLGQDQWEEQTEAITGDAGDKSFTMDDFDEFYGA